jgi:2-keto-4-pentenoate hydratase/2-oxohepta-3-ene-1,7-dioic acid hydratase in catechol pathway
VEETMKLVRFGRPGEERPGVWLDTVPERDGPAILDVRAMAFDIRDYDAHFFGRWGLARLRGLLGEQGRKLVDPEGLRLGAPVARPGKIVCVGSNYAQHAAEFGKEVPRTPVFFCKAGTSLQGPCDPIVLPAGARLVDAEVELALVVGRAIRGISADQALDALAGFCVLNDVTDRETQRAGKQWFRGKGPDTFCPMGPFLVTPDEVGDPQALRLTSSINGEPVQDGNTRDMTFKISELVAALSENITLEPGDVISTGTPSGVGSARSSPRCLETGDMLELTIDGLGRQRSPVVQAATGGMNDE